MNNLPPVISQRMPPVIQTPRPSYNFPRHSGICVNCAQVSRPVAKGSLVMELVLWFLFIVPGLIYSIWRATSADACPKCGGAMISRGTPRGRELLQKYYPGA